MFIWALSFLNWRTCKGLLPPNLLFAFVPIGLFPLSVRDLFRFLKRFKKSKEDLPLEANSSLIG